MLQNKRGKILNVLINPFLGALLGGELFRPSTVYSLRSSSNCPDSAQTDGPGRSIASTGSSCWTCPASSSVPPAARDAEDKSSRLLDWAVYRALKRANPHLQLITPPVTKVPSPPTPQKNITYMYIYIYMYLCTYKLKPYTHTYIYIYIVRHNRITVLSSIFLGGLPPFQTPLPSVRPWWGGELRPPPPPRPPHPRVAKLVQKPVKKRGTVQ